MIDDLPTWETDLIVAVDTETSGLHPDDRLPEGGHPRVAAVSLAWLDRNDIFQTRAYPFDQGARDKLPVAQTDLFSTGDPNLGEEEWIQLLDWLGQQRLVFHNAKFDLMMLRAGTRHFGGADFGPETIWDTMVAQRVIDPTWPVGLDDVERRRFKTTTKKDLDAKLKQALASLPKGMPRRYDLVEWDRIRDYAANDARLTIELYYQQQDRLSVGEGDPAQCALEMDLMKVLYQIEARGIGYDEIGSTAASREIVERARLLAESMPFDPSINSAKRYFFTQLGLTPYAVTDKGKPVLDLEVLGKMVRDGVPWAKEYGEHSALMTANSMWYSGYPGMIGDDGRLRTSFKQTRVVSGRMSVERIQLQAVPKDDKAIPGVPTVRSLFRPAEGYELWNLDLSQAELRVASRYADCTRMLELLAEGADLHGITTKEVLGVYPGETGSEQHDYKTCHCSACEEFVVQRDIAKRLTFGGIFQIGGKTFKATLSKLAGIDLPLAECETIVANWRSTYPEFGWAYRRAEQAVRDRGYVKLMGGVRSYFGPRDYPNSAWNRMVQGSLAQFLKYWLIAAEKDLAEAGTGHTVLTVHDSIVLELKEGLGRSESERVAAWTGELATEMFGIEMSCDIKEWG